MMVNMGRLYLKRGTFLRHHNQLQTVSKKVEISVEVPVNETVRKSVI